MISRACALCKQQKSVAVTKDTGNQQSWREPDQLTLPRISQLVEPRGCLSIFNGGDFECLGTSPVKAALVKSHRI